MVILYPLRKYQPQPPHIRAVFHLHQHLLHQPPSANNNKPNPAPVNGTFPSPPLFSMLQMPQRILQPSRSLLLRGNMAVATDVVRALLPMQRLGVLPLIEKGS